MRRASVLLICSIGLGSLGGCAATGSVSTPAPEVVTTQRCPRPAKPTLPKIRGDIPFDHPDQVEAILTRDARLRVYSAQCNAALDCYDAQATTPEGK